MVDSVEPMEVESMMPKKDVLPFENRRILNQLARNSRMVYWKVDADGYFLEVGEVVEDLLGYRPEELVGRMRYDALCPESEREALVAKAEAIMAGKSAFRDMENCAVAKDGRLVWVSSSGLPILDEEGNLTGYEGWDVDITRSKELEAQLLHAQRMEGVGTLAAGMAHNLNNTLTPVLVAVELLKQGEEDGEKLAQLEMIEVSAKRSADLVRQLLSYAQGLTGRRREREPWEIVEGLARIVGESFPPGLRVESHVAPGLPQVVCNAAHIQQALVNMCINAYDAMPGGGLLRITASLREVGEQEIGRHPGAQAGPYVVFEVIDDGEGIKAADLERVFDPFFTTKPVGKGTGLGLSSALGIIRSHGGFIGVESTPGEGTAFRVHLPVSSGGGSSK